MTTTTTPAPAAHTTRRNLLIAAPAVATALAIPAVAMAQAGDIGWNAAKAAYRRAVQREDKAGIAHDELEKALCSRGPAPTRRIRYQVTVRGQSFDAVHTIHPNDCDKPDPDFANHPDFAAYRAEVEAYRKGEANLRAQHDADTIEREWADAVDARVEAWKTLASFPAPTLRLLAEKAELCGNDHTRECDGCQDLLIASLAADAKRLARQEAA